MHGSIPHTGLIRIRVLSEFIIHSYKFNNVINNHINLKGMGKELLYVAVTEIMKMYPTLKFLEGKVAAIKKQFKYYT